MLGAHPIYPVLLVTDLAQQKSSTMIGLAWKS